MASSPTATPTPCRSKYPSSNVSRWPGETLLNGFFDRQGVGVAVGEDAVYVTQVFC